MARFIQILFSASLLSVAAACASTQAASSASLNLSASGIGITNASPAVRGESECLNCDAIPMPTEMTRAVESRIADLKARGGECEEIGNVLEKSYRSGQITLRPYMWRVGSHLASGEATPNGDMVLAREVDSLNVGVRTIDDVLWTMQHEAAHIAFDLVSGNEASEEKANQTVRACDASPSQAPARGDGTALRRRAH